MRNALPVSVAFVLLLSAQAVSAESSKLGVAMKDGRFVACFTDIGFARRSSFKIERVYRSNAQEKGWFGYGWGSEYETTLEPQGDGTVLIRENGEQGNLFEPDDDGRLEERKATISAIIEKMVFWARRQSRFSSQKEEDEYRANLGNVDFRSNEWRFLKEQQVEWTADFDALDETTKWHGQRGRQSLVRTKEGYELTFQNGRREVFDQSGRLAAVISPDKSSVQLEYDGKGRAKLIKDNLGRQFVLVFNVRGLIERIDSDRNRSSFYRYNAKDELTYVRDVESRELSYEYDLKRPHKLNRILYDDNTAAEIAYCADTDATPGYVRTFKPRDGAGMAYTYVRGTKETDPALRVVVQIAGKEAVKTETHSFFAKPGAAGPRWRVVTESNGTVTETEWDDENCP